MDLVVCLYALILSQLINPDFVDLFMKAVFRVLRLQYNFILRPHFDGNLSGELLYSPDFSESPSEKVICNKDIILEFGYKPGMPKDAKYPIRAVNLKTKRTAESVIDKTKWDCYYNLFSSAEGKMVCIRAWKMNVCVYDLINFVTTYDNPHVYKEEVFPNFSRYLCKKSVYIFNIFLTFFSSLLKVRYIIIMNAILLVLFFVRFLKREIIWRYFCNEFAWLTMLIQDFVHSRFGSSFYQKMKFLHTCCPDDRKTKKCKDVGGKFLVTGWKGHSFYRTNDRISIPICVSSLKNHEMDPALEPNSELLFTLRGVDITILIVESTSYKYKVKVETNNTLGQKMKWEGDVKVPNFHCFIDALNWLQGSHTYHVRTFQPYREVMHAKNIINVLRDVNEQDFIGFGILIIKKNVNFYIGNECTINLNLGKTNFCFDMIQGCFDMI